MRDFEFASRGAKLISVTPADTDISPPLLGVLVGTSGTLVCTNQDGTTCTIPAAAVVAGVTIPLPRVKRIAAASTAASIVGYQAVS